MVQNKNAITVCNLRKSFKDISVLKDVNFHY